MRRGVVLDTNACACEPETSDITVLRPMLAMSRCSDFLPEAFVTLLHKLSDMSCSLASAILRTSKPRLQQYTYVVSGLQWGAKAIF